jgi:hypothetical protein
MKNCQHQQKSSISRGKIKYIFEIDIAKVFYLILKKLNAKNVNINAK